MSVARLIRPVLWTLVLLLLAACQVAGSTNDSIPETGDDDQPFIRVSDQLFETTVLVDAVIVFEPAWLVIRAERSGRPAEIVGYTRVTRGEHLSVEVEIDPVSATDRLYAMLYMDAGILGEFEVGDADAPILINGQIVAQTFNLSEVSGDLVVEDLPDEARIVMADDRFEPGRVTLRLGATVSWVNQSDEPHSVVAEDHSFRSETLEPGEEFEYTFTNPGRYPYFCEFKGGPGGRGMAGVIVVRE